MVIMSRDVNKILRHRDARATYPGEKSIQHYLLLWFHLSRKQGILPNFFRRVFRSERADINFYWTIYT